MKTKAQELRQKIADNFRKVRIKKRLSQLQVYKATGIHVGSIGIAMVDMRVGTLLALCQHYGVSPSAMFKKIERIK